MLWSPMVSKKTVCSSINSKIIRCRSLIENDHRPANLPFSLCVPSIELFQSLRNNFSLRSADNFIVVGNFLYRLKKRDEYSTFIRCYRRSFKESNTLPFPSRISRRLSITSSRMAFSARSRITLRKNSLVEAYPPVFTSRSISFFITAGTEMFITFLISKVYYNVIHPSSVC